MIDVDGVRVLFPNGWGLVRASNTQPVLVMRFEAANAKLLAEYRKEVEDVLASARSAVAAGDKRVAYAAAVSRLFGRVDGGARRRR